MNVAELIELLKGQPPERRVVLRVSPAECCRTRFHGYRLHEGAILSRERCRPDGLVARFWQHVAELDHLSRRQLAKVDSDGTPTFSLRHQRDRFSHQLDHASLVHGRTPRSDVAIDKDVIVL